MGRQLVDGSEARFAAYVEELASAIGHADRVAPLEAYCTGLLLPCERKSVEPMAAVTAPARVSAQHQSLLHFISQGGWSDQRSWARYAKWWCRIWNGTERLRHGSLMIQASRNRGSTRWA